MTQCYNLKDIIIRNVSVSTWHGDVDRSRVEPARQSTVAQCRGLYSSFSTALRCFPSFRFHACPETPPIYYARLAVATPFHIPE